MQHEMLLRRSGIAAGSLARPDPGSALHHLRDAVFQFSRLRAWASGMTARNWIAPQTVAKFGAGISCLNGAIYGCAPQKGWKIRKGESEIQAPNEAAFAAAGKTL